LRVSHNIPEDQQPMQLREPRLQWVSSTVSFLLAFSAVSENPIGRFELHYCNTATNRVFGSGIRGRIRPATDSQNHLRPATFDRQDGWTSGLEALKGLTVQMKTIAASAHWRDTLGV